MPQDRGGVDLAAARQTPHGREGQRHGQRHGKVEADQPLQALRASAVRVVRDGRRFIYDDEVFDLEWFLHCGDSFAAQNKS